MSYQFIYVISLISTLKGITPLLVEVSCGVGLCVCGTEARASRVAVRMHRHNKWRARREKVMRKSWYGICHYHSKTRRVREECFCIYDAHGAYLSTNIPSPEAILKTERRLF